MLAGVSETDGSERHLRRDLSGGGNCKFNPAPRSRRLRPGPDYHPGPP
jgi:hypothetical protein